MKHTIIRDLSYHGVTPKNDDDLQHFKYISRKKGKNGKWVYKYNEPKETTESRSSTSEKETDEFIFEDRNDVRIRKTVKAGMTVAAIALIVIGVNKASEASKEKSHSKGKKVVSKYTGGN